ncbi:hypothetical protein E3N88_14712 [Mikania micrantha]|uniref:ATP-dependent DNA helicase n=1 Tax=Mikania micrantha TaxID=192012 RepID=A0A5N6P2G9_9ASTR|nr:hypothetical protein E3N88_14712 [Mikania micrantha]
MVGCYFFFIGSAILTFFTDVLLVCYYFFFSLSSSKFQDTDIITAVENNIGGIFFVYGYGGTGKTFLWKTLSTCIRSKGQIVINVASSGIASLLLTGGRTAHSRFHIPLNLNEDSMCYMKPNSDVAELLKETKLIICDEAPMVHKHAFEALDRTMRDILLPHESTNTGVPFGGKTIVFCGDFRQILPVIKNGTRQEIVNGSLSSSYIWNKCKLLKLTKNMRLNLENQSADLEKTKEFANWLLQLGEGNLGGINDGDTTIEIPDDLLIDAWASTLKLAMAQSNWRLRLERNREVNTQLHRSRGADETRRSLGLLLLQQLKASKFKSSILSASHASKIPSFFGKRGKQDATKIGKSIIPVAQEMGRKNQAVASKLWQQ